MAITTQITMQQLLATDQGSVTVAKSPRYIVSLGNSISSITAAELTDAVNKANSAATNAKNSENAAKASETAAKSSQTAAKTSETNAKTSETNAAISAALASERAPSWILRDNSTANVISIKMAELNPTATGSSHWSFIVSGTQSYGGTTQALEYVTISARGMAPTGQVLTADNIGFFMNHTVMVSPRGFKSLPNRIRFGARVVNDKLELWAVLPAYVNGGRIVEVSSSGSFTKFTDWPNLAGTAQGFVYCNPDWNFSTNNPPEALDVNAVKKTGDTMTGNLAIKAGSGDSFLDLGPTGRIRVNTGDQMILSTSGKKMFIRPNGTDTSLGEATLDTDGTFSALNMEVRNPQGTTSNSVLKYGTYNRDAYTLKGTRTNAVDWDTLTEFGAYKMQNTTVESGANASTNYPPGGYGYGILYVLRGDSNDNENRIIQIYYPHRMTPFCHYRMRNGGTWYPWSVSSSDSDVLAQVRNFNDRRYTDVRGSGGTPIWLRLFEVKGLAQNGFTASIQLFGSAGYNAATTQFGFGFLQIRTGNNSITTINGAGRAAATYNQVQGNTIFTELCARETSASTYEVWGRMPAWTQRVSACLVTSDALLNITTSGVTMDFSTYQNDKPTDADNLVTQVGQTLGTLNPVVEAPITNKDSWRVSVSGSANNGGLYGGNDGASLTDCNVIIKSFGGIGFATTRPAAGTSGIVGYIDPASKLLHMDGMIRGRRFQFDDTATWTVPPASDARDTSTAEVWDTGLGMYSTTLAAGYPTDTAPMAVFKLNRNRQFQMIVNSTNSMWVRGLRSDIATPAWSRVATEGTWGLGRGANRINVTSVENMISQLIASGRGGQFFCTGTTGSSGMPTYSNGFFSKSGDTHTAILTSYSTGTTVVVTGTDSNMGNPIVNTLYGNRNPPSAAEVGAYSKAESDSTFQKIAPSDRSLKENVRYSLSSATDKIRKIKLFEFDFTSTAPTSVAGKHVDHGFVAQQLETVDPDFVGDNGSFKYPELLPLVALGIKGVQELADTINTLQQRVAELEAKLK